MFFLSIYLGPKTKRKVFHPCAQYGIQPEQTQAEIEAFEVQQCQWLYRCRSFSLEGAAKIGDEFK